MRLRPKDLDRTVDAGTPAYHELVQVGPPVRRQANLPGLRLHVLRHSCATILVALAIHPRVVMEMLRHSQIGITMNTYSHVAPLLQREGADALEAALFG